MEDEQKLTDFMFDRQKEGFTKLGISVRKAIEMTDLVQHLEENGWVCVDQTEFTKGTIGLFVGDDFISIHYAYSSIATCRLKQGEALLQLFDRTKRKAKKLVASWCKKRNKTFFSDIEKFKSIGEKYGVKPPTQSDVEKFKTDCDGFVAKTSELAVAVKEL